MFVGWVYVDFLHATSEIFKEIFCYGFFTTETFEHHPSSALVHSLCWMQHVGSYTICVGAAAQFEKRGNVTKELMTLTTML
jgi:hypothetical protein